MLPGCPTKLPLQEGLSAVLLAFFCLTCLLLLVPLLLLFARSILPRCSGWLAPEDSWLCPLEPTLLGPTKLSNYFLVTRCLMVSLP